MRDKGPKVRSRRRQPTLAVSLDDPAVAEFSAAGRERAQPEPRASDLPPSPAPPQGSVSGTSNPAAPGSRATPSPIAESDVQPSAADFPWLAAHVRDDVKKPFILRLPEPLALKIGYLSETTRLSRHAIILAAVEERVAKLLGDVDD